MNTFDELVSNISITTKIQEFKYYKEFIKLWKQKETECEKLNITYSTEAKDDSQIFHYNGQFYNVPVSFDFNIQYIDELLKSNLHNGKIIFPKIELKNYNGKLMYFEAPCIYTSYNENELLDEYSNIDEVLISPLPILPDELIVIDGNHRVCKQIYHNISVITAYYVLEGVAVRSLLTPLQMCIYSFLFDVAKILYNTGKISDGKIRNKLSIFNHNSSFYSCYNRKR